MNPLAASAGSDLGSIAAAFAIALAGLFAYALPSLVAARRRVPAMNTVVMVNLLLGWTVVGWVVALVMAASGPNLRRFPPRPSPPYWR
jgi:hypothetical protein